MAFSSFHNVAVKAKQVRSIRIEQNFFKDSSERSQICKMCNKLVKAREISSSHNILKTVLDILFTD